MRGAYKLMKKLKKMQFIPLVLISFLVVNMITLTTTYAAQPTVELGTSSTFAVLAGTTITNTGDTVISGEAGGDVGLSPGTSITGQENMTISGEIHIANEVASKAKDDLVTAYNDAADRTPVTVIPAELGETTLTPGVYESVDGTFQITGTLTLDAEGDPDAVFLFKTASTLITASDSDVELINDARFCRTFWQVTSSATLGSNSNFAGHIFALTSITANTGASIEGQLLAMNGAVTLDNNIIENGICETSTTVPPEIEVEPSVPSEIEVETTVPSETEVEITVLPVTKVESTVSGGQLPKTSTPLYSMLFMGGAFTILGTLGWLKRKRYE